MKKIRLLFIVATATLLLFTGCGSDTKKSTAVTPATPNIYVPSIKLATVGSGVALNSNILLTFITDVNTSTASATSVILQDSALNTVTTLVTASGKFVTIAPDALLNANTTYTITLTTDLHLIKDGNISVPLDKNYTYDFTTGDISDTTLPYAVSFYPTMSDTNVSIHGAIALTLSEDMNTSIATATLNGSAVPVLQGNRQMLIRPTTMLDYNTTYTVSITNAFDLAGNAFNSSWSFTTQSAPTLTTTWDGNNSQYDIAAVSRNWFIIRDNNLTQAFEYDNGTIRSDGNMSIYLPGDTNHTHIQIVYNEEVFIASGNVLLNMPLRNDSNTTFTLDYNKTVLDYNISTFHINNDRACLISYDNNSVNLYGIYAQGDYELNQPLGTLNLDAQQCLIHNKTAYITTLTSGIHAYDLTSETTLGAGGQFNANTATNLTATNDRLFTTQGTQLVEYNLTTPTSPTLSSSLELNITLGEVHASSDYLFVSEQNGTKIFVIDLATSTPRLYHTIDTGYLIKRFVVTEEAVVVMHTLGEAIFDTNELFFIHSKEKYLGGTFNSITAVNGAYFIADGTNGVKVVDKHGQLLITNGSSVGALRISSFTNDLNQSFIAVAKGDNGVDIFSVDTAYNMSLESSITGIGRVYSVNAIADKLVVGTDKGILRYDITDANITAPVLDGNISEYGAIFGLASYIDANTTIHVFSADYTMNMVHERTFDANWTYLGETNITTQAPPRDMAIDKLFNDVYVAMGSGGVMAIDGTNIYNSYVVPTPGYAMGLYAYSYTDSEFNTTRTEVVVADYTGLAVLNVTRAVALTGMSFDFFAPAKGAIYDIDILGGDNGPPMPVDRNGYIVLLDEGATSSSIILDPTDPVSTVTTTFNTNTAAASVPLFDPFY